MISSFLECAYLTIYNGYPTPITAETKICHYSIIRNGLCQYVHKIVTQGVVLPWVTSNVCRSALLAISPLNGTANKLAQFIHVESIKTSFAIGRDQ